MWDFVVPVWDLDFGIWDLRFTIYSCRCSNTSVRAARTSSRCSCAVRKSRSAPPAMATRSRSGSRYLPRTPAAARVSSAPPRLAGPVAIRAVQGPVRSTSDGPPEAAPTSFLNSSDLIRLPWIGVWRCRRRRPIDRADHRRMNRTVERNGCIARHGDRSRRPAGRYVADIGAVVEHDVMQRRVVVPPDDAASRSGARGIGRERAAARLADDRDRHLRRRRRRWSGCGRR